jgi:hypothetical protein
VVALKLAQAGRFWTLKVSASPFASEATGVKLYADPTFTVAAGTPAIVGAVLVTVIENGAREAVDTPSLTVMMMLEYVPTFTSVGVPVSSPVLLLKVAQVGLPEIENVLV